MMLIFLIMLVRWGFEAYRDMKQRWTSGTRRERFTLAAVMVFVLEPILITQQPGKL